MNVIYYGIDEAIFLALRLLMINGSAANIIEVLDIPFACLRVRARIMEDRQYYKLWDRFHNLLYLCS